MSTGRRATGKRHRRLYALFECFPIPCGDGAVRYEWRRISKGAYELEYARRYFQSQLLAPFLAGEDNPTSNRRELRPVREP